MDHVAGDGHIVIFEEDKFAAEFRASGEFDDGLDELLAVLIARMSFASVDDLHGAVGVVQDAGEALGILKKKSGAFVGGEAAAEADSECIGRENFLSFINGGLRSAAIFELRLEAAAGESDKALAAAFVGTPEFTSGDGLGALPESGVGGLFAPLGAKIAIVELIHFEGNPTAEVDTISDVANGDFRFREAAPDGVPHTAADDTMKLTDGIAEGGEAQSEDSHTEAFGVVGGVLAAESEKVAEVEAETRIER